jgi:hypothetical protein
MTPAPRERRREPRISATLPFELIEEGGGFTICACANVSCGGAFLAQQAPRRMGSRLCLNVVLPRPFLPIPCVAEVVNLAAHPGEGIGVRFVAMTKLDRLRLAGFLRNVSAASA